MILIDGLIKEKKEFKDLVVGSRVRIKSEEDIELEEFEDICACCDLDVPTHMIEDIAGEVVEVIAGYNSKTEYVDIISESSCHWAICEHIVEEVVS